MCYIFLWWSHDIYGNIKFMMRLLNRCGCFIYNIISTTVLLYLQHCYIYNNVVISMTILLHLWQCCCIYDNVVIVSDAASTQGTCLGRRFLATRKVPSLIFIPRQPSPFLAGRWHHWFSWELHYLFVQVVYLLHLRTLFWNSEC